MAQPGNGESMQNPQYVPSTPEATQPTQTQVAQAPTQQQMVQAIEQVERNKNRRKLTRRALLGAAGVGVCAGAVVAAPLVVEKAGYYTKQELDQALQNGIQQGRQELLAELRNLEGVGLDVAISLAGLADFAVVHIVKPLADLNATIQGDILGALAAGVAQAQSALAHVNVHIGILDNLESLLNQWHTNVSQDQLGQYAVQDVTQAEIYLKALKKKIDGESSKSS
jgi:hypothetical protein